MKAIKLAWLELRRFRGPVRRYVPILLILVPLLYGALYLWSNWDPYGRLDQVPVAVVNSDHPVESNGERIDAGNQFVRQLKEAPIFDWHFVSGDEARDGLQQGRYYFTIQVPSNFSAKLATASEPDPQRATLLTTKNDANGYIAGIMADTVESKLQNQINAAAHASYARSLYGQLGDARHKLDLASQASQQLVSGTQLSQQGTAALTTGLGGVRDGTAQVSRGTEQISDATAEVDRRLSAITDFASAQLPQTVNSLVSASQLAVSNLSTIKTGTAFVADRGEENATKLQRLGETHPDLTGDSTYRDSLDSARKLAGATRTLDANAGQALSKAQAANERAVALQNNMGALQNRVQSITAPLDTLRAGTAELAGGTNGLTNGVNSLLAGGGTLQSGAGQLNDGAKRLDSLIHGSLDKIPPTNPTQVARAADVLGSPTTIATTNLNPAYVYGRGLAPFFFGIALWVFGLFAYLLLKPVNTRGLASRARTLTLTLGGWLPAAALGVVGGLVLFAVVNFGLGLDPQNMLTTIGLVSLAVGAFVAIDHFLRTAFGVIGDVLSLVLLVLQLTASGGLYPMETTPVPFQAVHPFLPMTYLVDGLRVTISGGMAEHLNRDAAVLGGFLVVFLGLTALVVANQRMWTVRRLHPPIDL